MAYLKKNYLMIVLIFASAIGFSLWLSDRYSRSTEAFSSQEQQFTVVLDAGHGGEDGGAVSCTGVHESEINLEISNRLADLFPLLGVRVVCLRTEDKSVYDPSCVTVSEKKVSDLKNRVRMVNEIPNGILVSIHQNEFPEAKYSGAQVFYAPGCEALAEEVQQTLRLGLNPSNNRQCKSADNIYLMNHITCPGILIECGFLSNPDEEAKLRQPDYQKRLAVCIAASVCQYLQKETNDEV
ncbi:MAG: N-acetylmuramoyl-L-alanine amidase [Clostridia bacterium]|nr:N-acetylmuramoyl-L-alanine amidase [Clostridia bacterium]